MQEIIDIVPFAAAPEWGPWEPLALTMILSAGAAAVAAGIAALRRVKPFVVYLLSLTALCALASGLLGVFIPLEQPLRVWEFAVHPAFTSWTAWGSYFLPLCLVCMCVMLWQSGKGGAVGRAPAVAAVVLGLLALAYATGEVRACVGRVLWTDLLTFVSLLAAGVVGMCGLCLLLWLRLKFENVSRGGEHAVPLLQLASLCLALTALCAALTWLARAPQGYAAVVGPWWHAPEMVSALLAAAALALRNSSPERLAARGVFAVVSAVLLLWKIIHMGEIFGRNASLYSARAAFGDLLTPGALAAFGGTVGLLVLLGTLVPYVRPSSRA